jgi:hypothetical protein
MLLITCVLVLTCSASPVPADPPFAPEVEALLKKLTDPDAAKRAEAIQSLGFLSQTVRVTAGARDVIGKESDPKVRGLVPYLARAVAADTNEENRAALVLALADTRDPAAVAAVRERLKDKSESVRFAAACVLTEFKDAAGLDELKKALARLRTNDRYPDVGMYDVQRLLASFERITGKSFGEIPPNPHTDSIIERAAASNKRYRELMDTWAAWWDWKPPAK